MDDLESYDLSSQVARPRSHKNRVNMQGVWVWAYQILKYFVKACDIEDFDKLILDFNCRIFTVFSSNLLLM